MSLTGQQVKYCPKKMQKAGSNFDMFIIQDLTLFWEPRCQHHMVLLFWQDTKEQCRFMSQCKWNGSWQSDRLRGVMVGCATVIYQFTAVMYLWHFQKNAKKILQPKLCKYHYDISLLLFVQAPEITDLCRSAKCELLNWYLCRSALPTHQSTPLAHTHTRTHSY